jgi:hypothetical protein
MHYVRQELDYDCGVSALAMVTDLPRATVLRWVEPYIHNSHGINEFTIEDFLIAHGFAYQTIRRYQNAGSTEERSPWPVPPFAPRHIVEVEATRGFHFVAMDSRGHVLDPWNPERTSLDHPDYKRVVMTWGVWAVATIPPR